MDYRDSFKVIGQVGPGDRDGMLFPDRQGVSVLSIPTH